MLGQAPLALFLAAAAALLASRGRVARGLVAGALAASALLWARLDASPTAAGAYVPLAAAAIVLAGARLPRSGWAEVGVRAVVPTVAGYVVYRTLSADAGWVVAGALALAGGGSLAIARAWPAPPAPVPPSGPPDEPAPPTATGESDPRPQWIRILECLEGSSPAAGNPPRREWTQKHIAEVLGISPARVSEFPRALNEGAAKRLDEYVAGWKPGGEGAAGPVLVERHRGAIPQDPGVWTYYRLTDMGERLLAGIRAREGADEPNSPKSPT